MRNRYHPYIFSVLIAFSLIGLSGCGGSRTRRNVTGATYKINDIHLHGVTRFKKRALLKYLYMAETSWLPFTETHYLNEARLPFDADSIAALYKSYGYFDAEVIEIKPVIQKRHQVDVHITVREGEPIRVTGIRFDWPEGPPAVSSGPGVTVPEVEAMVSLEMGDALETPLIEKSLSAMQSRLMSHGYALAKTEADVNADPRKRVATVTFKVTPGRFARIGPIRFLGLKRTPAHMAAAEVAFAEDAPYAPDLVKKIEGRIYAMDVFSTVEVVTGKAVHSDGRIPITVFVQEAKMQSIKVGAGIGFEPARWEQRVTTQYSHRDIFGDLVRLDLRLQAGYAELPTPFNLVEHGPIARFTPKLTKKGWLEKKLVWTAAPSIELGVEEGYKFYTPGTRLGVSRFFGDIFLTELSHNFTFFDFFQVQKTLNTNRTLLGLDFRDPYLLSYLEVESRLYLTDRVLDPDNGAVIGARYDIAGGPFGGHYDFHKITPEIRGYWRIVPRLQLAFRAATGFIFPYGDRPAVPFNMKFYLGGADTVRGFGLKRLSPKTTRCPDETDRSCRRIPIGGETVVLGNAEVRVRTIDELYVVAFLDMGDVQPGELTYRPNEWALTSGGGLRYGSPVGKIRLDIGARLNDTPLSRGEDRWAFHLGLGESF